MGRGKLLFLGERERQLYRPEESYNAVIFRRCDRLTDDEPLSEEKPKTSERSPAGLREGIYSSHEKIVCGT
jgi:hypothetical protein